ncbi:MAG: hypothetical protein KA319_04035 [Ferruginibacter sp.]|nr:hypothetical protein [Ferruginibacter sp.]
MRLFNFLKRQNPNKKACIYFIQEKAIVFTQYYIKKDTNTTIREYFSILESNCSEDILGEKILHHLAYSKRLNIDISNYSAEFTKIFNSIGYKTMKSVTEFSQYISFEEKDNELIITPFTNINAGKKNQYFMRNPKAEISILKPFQSIEIGKTTLRIKNECLFK